MPASDVSGQPKPRLNPLPFPSDITLRFDLLIVLVVCVSSQFYGHFWESIHVEQRDALAACASGVVTRVFDAGANVTEQSAQSAQAVMPQVATCMALLRPQTTWKIAGIVVTLALGALFYWLFPLWKLKTQRLAPIARDDPPGLFDALDALCREAQLTPAPSFVWNPLASGLPVTFGRRRDYYVALSGAFVARYFYADRAAFRAVILHELAHIRNRDIDKTFMTISACLAFVIVSVVPLLGIGAFGARTWHQSLFLLGKTALWSALVLLSGASVLRVREFYADLQASQWDESPAQVDRVLARLAAASPHGHSAYPSLHPRGEARRAVLVDTTPLFRLDKWDALGIGFAAGVVIETINGFLIGFVPAGSASAVARVSVVVSIVTPLAVMILAIGALSTGIWRGAYAAVMNGRDPVKGTAAAGALFALGYFLNQVLIGAEFVLGGESAPRLAADHALRLLEIHVIALVFAIIGCWLICNWIARAAAAWVGVTVKSASPLPVLKLTGAISIAVVAAMFAWGAFASASLGSLGPDNNFYTSLVMIAPPLVVGALAAWLFPWSSRWFARLRHDLPLSGWVFLDDTMPRVDTSLRLAEFRPARAISTGVLIGLVFCLWIELLRFRRLLPPDAEAAIHASFTPLVRIAQRAGSSGFALVMPIAFAAALAAFIAAWRRGTFNALYGLCAGSVAGIVMSVGGLVTIELNAQSTLDSALTSVLLYLCVASVAALLGAMAGAVVGRMRGSVEPQPSVSVMRRGVIVSLAAVVIAGWVKSILDI
ncbi:M48 family metalloprotease [Caballeronia concitans]|uniref:Heat shock protein HtpX n=1 Tax=Caballeronia concitans TaxID=1777133 RepID=A0A658QTA6_9BURK|nr:M48 family metalloprotease [Caballeronia concitans]SAL19632.1 heat shock protein HtpX [Caballeronia concitans]